MFGHHSWAVLQLTDFATVYLDEESSGYSSDPSVVSTDSLDDFDDEMEVPAESDELANDHEEPDLPEYHEEPLTEAELRQLTADLSTTIKYHGKDQSLEDHLNLELLGPQGLARCSSANLNLWVLVSHAALYVQMRAVCTCLPNASDHCKLSHIQVSCQVQSVATARYGVVLAVYIAIWFVLLQGRNCL